MAKIVLKDKDGSKNSFVGINIIKIPDGSGAFGDYIPSPTEELKISRNGVFDVLKYKTVKVNVAGGGNLPSAESLSV